MSSHWMKFQFTLDGRTTVKINMTSRGGLKLGGNSETNGDPLYLRVLCNEVGDGGMRRRTEK